jgi:RNA-directed DNA polymerase
MINSDKASYRSGGVGAGSGVGKESGLSREISTGGPQVQPGGQAGHTSKASRAEGEVGAARSSVDPQNKRRCGEPRGGTRTHALQNSEGPGDGCAEGTYPFEQIATPPKVRKLQRTLYQKAKAEPKYRFWSLYSEVSRIDIIELAMTAVALNGGSPGVDGEAIRAYNADDQSWNRWRDALISELRHKTYRPSPVRRVYIPKADGKLRPLGIPTVKDRVVQAAFVLVLLPIFEADFHEHSFAYRPGRNAHQALRAISHAIWRGKREVIDADLSGYFDSIPHRKLMKLVAKRVSDGTVLGLIRAWLRAPIVEENAQTRARRILPNKQGTPQGGVISPLLANLYLDALDKAVNNPALAGQPTMIRYADDFVVLCRPGQGPALLARLKTWLSARGLKLNETKTRLLHAAEAEFKFLGYSICLRKSPKGRWYVHQEPHRKSCQKFRDSVRELLNHWTLHEPVEEVVQNLNRKAKGWANYFHPGNSTKAFARMQRFINERLRRWLWRKGQCRRARYKAYADETLYCLYDLWKLPTHVAWKGPKC